MRACVILCYLSYLVVVYVALTSLSLIVVGCSMLYDCQCVMLIFQRLAIVLAILYAVLIASDSVGWYMICECVLVRDAYRLALAQSNDQVPSITHPTAEDTAGIQAGRPGGARLSR